MSAENSKQEIVLTDDTLRYIALFQQLTHTNAVDCMDTPDKLVFVVEKGQGNIAVGKKGEHVIKLKEITGKNIQVVEYSDDPAQFVMNVFHVYKPQKVVIGRQEPAHSQGYRQQASRYPEPERRVRPAPPVFTKVEKQNLSAGPCPASFLSQHQVRPIGRSPAGHEGIIG